MSMTRYEVLNAELVRLHSQYALARGRHDINGTCDTMARIKNVYQLLAQPERPAAEPLRPHWFRRRGP